MITFKQMEAVVWIAELGSFEAAANRLHTSQSAISKRIHELETSLGVLLFDRSGRSAYLTEKGKELVDLGGDLLKRRDELISKLSDDTTLPHRFRIGVTELTGLTWLPTLIRCIRERYPRLKIEPSIELSKSLFNKLENDQLDMIIAPDNFHDERFTRVSLGQVKNAWMTAEHVSGESKLSIHDLDRFNVLTQGSDSGTGMIYDRWLSSMGVHFSRILNSDYLLAQVGMTLAGLGISYIPYRCFEFLVRQGMLQVLDVYPELPAIQYVAMFRTKRHNTLHETIVDIAIEHCNFNELFLFNIQRHD